MRNEQGQTKGERHEKEVINGRYGELPSRQIQRTHIAPSEYRKFEFLILNFESNMAQNSKLRIQT
jgi:hypothetical protein